MVGQLTNGDILILVRQALDEFESIGLEACLRRTIRIANLLGESEIAVRLSLELRPAGGHPPTNKAETIRLLTDSSDWDAAGGPGRAAIQSYMGDRAVGKDGDIMAHSIADLEYFDALPHDDFPLSTVFDGRRIMGLARQRAFVALCDWERQLGFVEVQQSALDRVDRRVTDLLATSAPDVLVQFNSAFRRLHEALDRDNGAEVHETLSQAVASCRRILKAVVDVVQPADPARRASDDGHALTDDAYRNRLFEFLKDSISSNSHRGAVQGAGEALWERFGAVDKIASKGVHARVAIDEAEFCALQTYLIAGEVIALVKQPAASNDPRPPS